MTKSGEIIAKFMKNHNGIITINKYLFRKKNISDEISNEMINRKYYTVFEKEDMAGKDRVYKKEFKRDINNTYDDKTVFLGREEDEDLTVFMGKKHREM